MDRSGLRVTPDMPKARRQSVTAKHSKRKRRRDNPMGMGPFCFLPLLENPHSTKTRKLTTRNINVEASNKVPMTTADFTP